jgi:hypothetical protein
LTEAQMKAWREGAAILSDHPAYLAERRLSEAELEELEGDFQ